MLFLFISRVQSLLTGRTVLWSLAGFLWLTWQVYIFSPHTHLSCTDFVTCSCYFSNFYMQLHIGFCIFAAVAPPIIFKGKSLTWVPSNIAFYVSILQTDILLQLIFNWFDLLEIRKTLGIAETFCDWAYWFLVWVLIHKLTINWKGIITWKIFALHNLCTKPNDCLIIINLLNCCVRLDYFFSMILM